MAKLLIIEDDPALLDGLGQLFLSSGYKVDQAQDLTLARQYFEGYRYDAIIVDWSLPDGSGPDFVSFTRQQGYIGPVLMLTAKTTLDCKEVGFDRGADDYVCKPFEAKELIFRVQALLRRAEKSYINTLARGNIVISVGQTIARVGGTEVILQPQEFAVLRLLMTNNDGYLSPEILLTRLWASDTNSGIETVRTTVYKLRKKLIAAGASYSIETQYKLGYRLAECDRLVQP